MRPPPIDPGGGPGETARGGPSAICLRQARPEEADAASALIHAAGPEIYDYVFAEGTQGAREFIAAECRSGRGLAGHTQVLLALLADRIVGAACFFDATEDRQLHRATLHNILKHYGIWRCMPVLLRARHVAPVLSHPGPEDLCLRNFAVAADTRGQGIGSAMLRAGISQARARGLRRLILDVAVTNPRARALYERLGFRPEGVQHCLNPQAAARVPGFTRMVLDLIPE